MRRTLGLALALGLGLIGFAAACGSPAPSGEATAVPAPETATAAPNATPIVPGPSVATHLELGIIYAGNMMGELEPCG